MRHATTRLTDRTLALAFSLMLAVVPAACGDGDAGGAAGGGGRRGTSTVNTAGDGSGSREVTQEFAPELGINLAIMARLPSGLYLRDLEVGQGEKVVNGKLIRVHYTGWLANGVEFDSSRDGEPLTFMVGQDEVIDAWDEAVVGMNVGGRRLLVVPPALAFGEGGLPGVVPPNSTLIFDLAVVEIVQQ